MIYVSRNTIYGSSGRRRGKAQDRWRASHTYSTCGVDSEWTAEVVERKCTARVVADTVAVARRVPRGQRGPAAGFGLVVVVTEHLRTVCWFDPTRRDATWVCRQRGIPTPRVAQRKAKAVGVPGRASSILETGSRPTRQRLIRCGSVTFTFPTTPGKLK
jgi:hypothetical protein